MNFTMRFTSPMLEECFSECDLSAPGARELKGLRVCVLIPDAFAAESDAVKVNKTFPMAAGVIEKARKDTAFRSKLGVVLTKLLEFEVIKSYPGIVCRCSQRRPVKDFSTRKFYNTSSEELELYAICIPYCDIPEHFSKSQQAADSPLCVEMLMTLLGSPIGRVKEKCFYFCAECEEGGKEIKMKFCIVCGVSPYCSRECQKAHWEEHKKVCTPSAEQTVP